MITRFKIFFILTVLFAISFQNQAQTTIKGIVYNENNEALEGATVILNNGEYGTISNEEGQFIFQNISVNNCFITVSAIGYATFQQYFSTDTLPQQIKIYLQPEEIILNEVEIISNENEILRKTESVSIQIILDEFLKASMAGSLMQTLNKIPGISSMDIGSGISKPMIRGMGFYRVVIAQNGIKQENQQWSSHHGLTVDQQGVQHVEIIKGSASLQYGSDAIGGVINVLSSHTPVNEGFTGSVSILGKSNSRWTGVSGEVSFKKNNLYFHSTVTHNSYGDYIIPVTDSFLMPAPVSAAAASHKVKLGKYVYNTAGNENAISFNTGILKPWGNSYLEFNFYRSKIGFFDWQGLKQDSIRALHSNSYMDISLPYQQVSNYSVNHITNCYFNDNKLEVALGFQSNMSEEHNFLNDRTGNRTADLIFYRNKNNLELKLDLQTVSANIFYTIQSLQKQKLKIGLNTQFQQHKTDGFLHILPDYKRFSTGIFLTHQYFFSTRFIFNSGARFDFHKYSINEAINPDIDYGEAIFNEAFQKNYFGTAFSLGVNFLPNSNTVIKMNIGKSYRIPSAYELSAYGLHRHEGRFEKGNLNNQPEKAYQLDFGYEKTGQNIVFVCSPFFNYFSNYLYLNPTPLLQPEGQVYEYKQQIAVITGAEASFGYNYQRKIDFLFDVEYVYAVNPELNMAIPFTPPLTFMSEITYLFKNSETFTNNSFGFELVTVAAQKYTVPNELTTNGYNILNMKLITEIVVGKQKLFLMLKIRNIANTKYYNHISFYRRLRIPEAGRDIQLFLSIPFGN